MTVLTKYRWLVAISVFLFISACGPVEPEMKPYDLIASEFMNNLSDGNIKEAGDLASENNGARAAVPFIHQTMQTMLSNSKKERIEFKWVSSSQRDDRASVVFAQVLDGESAMSNIRVILVKEGARENDWRVVDLEGV